MRACGCVSLAALKCELLRLSGMYSCLTLAKRGSIVSTRRNNGRVKKVKWLKDSDIQEASHFVQKELRARYEKLDVLLCYESMAVRMGTGWRK